MGFAVGLVHPFLKEAKNKNRLKFRESLALGYLSAALKQAGIAYRSINAELEFLDSESVASRLGQDLDVRLVGLSCKSQRTYRAGKEIARILKRERPDIHITLGGVLATAADAEVLAPIARHLIPVVRGEGEERIVDLASPRQGRRRVGGNAPGWTFRRDGGTIRNPPPRHRIGNLDDLAFPLRGDLQHVMEFGRSGRGVRLYRGVARLLCRLHVLFDPSDLRQSPRHAEVAGKYRPGNVEHHLDARRAQVLFRGRHFF